MNPQVPSTEMKATMNETETLDLNVGGINYSITKRNLLKHEDSRFHEWFHNSEKVCSLAEDGRGRFFIDRDGQLFRFILAYLRDDKIYLPDEFSDRQRLINEAYYFKLPKLVDSLNPRGLTTVNGDTSTKNTNTAGYITVGYQGSFSFGRQGLAADVNFRKINRILVCGRVSLCREVFGETLNEGRDPDRGHQCDRDRYTSRYYLKHNMIEQAFDMLALSGFKMITSCASGTSGLTGNPKPGSNTEEDRWAHYNEFIFYRSQ